jgi:hypothetical protein
MKTAQQNSPLLQSKGFKPRKGKLTLCLHCQKEFYTKPSSNQKLCSEKCKNLARQNRVELICKTCHKPYQRRPSNIKYRGTGYCCNKCEWESYRLKRGALSPSWKGGKEDKYDQLERRRPEYIAWRKTVFARDNYRCRIPNCNNHEHYVEPHHIKRWNDYPDLRYDPNNGITLCKKHHYQTRKREHLFELFFFRTH